MNKVTKGALAIGLGVALLVGGGGTLAVWNADAAAHAGIITTGDLKITATDGIWKNALNEKVTLDGDDAYRVVPGDRLTFTQTVTVKLEGKNMKAKLTTRQPSNTNQSLNVSAVTLTKEGVPFTDTELDPSDSGEYIATATVDFPGGTTGRTGVETTADLSAVGFMLDQVVPSDSTQQ